MNRMVSIYLTNKGMSNSLVNYFERCYNLVVETFTNGCIKITVQCPTLDILERLWSDTLSGHLDKVAEEYLMTSTIKTKLGVDTVKFKVTRRTTQHVRSRSCNFLVSFSTLFYWRYTISEHFKE